jgi:hypothetical protein
VLLVSGSLTFLYAPRLAANLPTPGMGLVERIDVGSYLLWVAVLAVLLLRGSVTGRPPRGSPVTRARQDLAAGVCVPTAIFFG